MANNANNKNGDTPIHSFIDFLAQDEFDSYYLSLKFNIFDISRYYFYHIFFYFDRKWVEICMFAVKLYVDYVIWNLHISKACRVITKLFIIHNEDNDSVHS